MSEIDDIILRASDNEYKVPMFGYQEWKDLCQEFAQEDELHPGLETILPALRRYIRDYKPPLPIKRPTYEEMSKCFYNLLETKSRRYVTRDFNPHTVRNKFDEKVMIDYMISASSTWGDVSNHFHCDNRYTCGWHSVRSTYELWNDPMAKDFRPLMLYLWREFKNERVPINEDKYRAAFRLSGYVATQFKPAVAKTVYEQNGAKRVVDISCGWGDRLAGFYTSNCTEDYLGCDPNKASYELYKKQCLAYEDLLQTPLFPVDVEFEEHDDWFEVRGNKRVRIYNRPAEDMDWDSIVEDRYDLMFTSPPYFGIEKYAEGQDCEDKQSWKRYNEYENWLHGFYFPVIDSLLEFCDKVWVNIVDPVVKNKRYHLEDDMRKRYNIPNIYGMKMARRPKGRAGEDHGRIETGQLLNFIEPIYHLEKK